MERLNDIINQAAQRRQQDGNTRTVHHTPPQGMQQPGSSPAHRPLPEQTARLGQYARTSRSDQQPGPVNRIPAPPPRSSPGEPLPRASHNTPNQSRYMQGNRNMVERFTPSPEHDARPQANHVSARYVESHHAAQADVQAEWEEDTAQIRYGDWENDMYDETAPPRVSDNAYPADRASARIAQTYGRNQRPMVTRELRSHVDEEVEPSVTPHTREARIPIPIAQPPASAAHRLTQPLNRSMSMARVEQHVSNAPRPARPQGQREQALSSMPAPYVPNTAICPICKGAGYLRADVPYGHPNFGKPIACECKRKEIDEKRRQQLQRLSNLAELHNKSFENFNPNASQSVYKAYCEALRYAEDPKGWLVLISKVGCGKTHLAAAIANEVLAGGSRVLFSTVIDLLDHLRKTYSPSATEVYDTVLGEMREAALLVLDDLGAQQSTPWATEKLFQLLNFRYNYGMPTIITTNDLDLQEIDERIRSRMTDASLVNAIVIDRTADYRPRNPRRE